MGQISEMTEGEAFDRMAAYCASAEHCRSEVAEKMQRWGVDYGVVEHVVERLVCEKYIDEDRYCRAFVNDKYRFDKWGKAKIAQALRLKKISPLVYGQALATIDQEEYLRILRGLLDSKRKSVRGGEERERNAKLVRFALSRGFEMDDIRLCMEVAEENDEPA